MGQISSNLLKTASTTWQHAFLSTLTTFCAYYICWTVPVVGFASQNSSCIVIILFYSCNRPFARSSHMVQNHTCWWASCTLGLPKQCHSYQSTWTCLCFRSLTAIQRAHVNDLLNLAPVFSDKDTTRLRKLYDSCGAHFRGLKALGVDETTFAAVVVPAAPPAKVARSISPDHHEGSRLSELVDGGIVERVFKGVGTEGRPLLCSVLGWKYAE